MIWKIAAKVAGLVLKPSKCFLVVTCVPLTLVVKQAIETWIRNEIPAWKHMQIVDHGKYLGVFLGVGGVVKTFKGCGEKYLSRCFDISLSVASALPTIVRYNERAVFVFGYISQVLLHPDIPRLKRLEQRGIHKVLKPKGHFSISDVVVSGELTDKMKNVVELYAGCISGAMVKDKYLNTISFQCVTYILQCDKIKKALKIQSLFSIVFSFGVCIYFTFSILFFANQRISIIFEAGFLCF